MHLGLLGAVAHLCILSSFMSSPTAQDVSSMSEESIHQKLGNYSEVLIKASGAQPDNTSAVSRLCKDPLLREASKLTVPGHSTWTWLWVHLVVFRVSGLGFRV